MSTKHENNSSLIDVERGLTSVNHDLMASNSRDCYEQVDGKVTRIYNDYYYETEDRDSSDSSNAFVKTMVGILVGVAILTIASASGLCGTLVGVAILAIARVLGLCGSR